MKKPRATRKKVEAEAVTAPAEPAPAKKPRAPRKKKTEAPAE